MIQRKQTLYLLIALVLTFVCLSFPLATFVGDDLHTDTLVTNLCERLGRGIPNFKTVPLFVLLLLTLPLNVWAIFAFKARKFQAKLCLINVILLVLWHVVAIYFLFFSTERQDTTLEIRFTAFFPLISLLLYVLARYAILADEKLVRAADRIR
ncbi:DUF4293 domain-containing protein [Segatella oulorum]|uniref:DUF4293 domain-containing protein n=1 Tax=Segatella oulorum TaxID=28136 RepID=UPI0028E72D92|nr:DUF4293 domain-containing protein [Segatella oulorum]